jgi:hypothetical protein
MTKAKVENVVSLSFEVLIFNSQSCRFHEEKTFSFRELAIFGNPGTLGCAHSGFPRTSKSSRMAFLGLMGGGGRGWGSGSKCYGCYILPFLSCSTEGLLM